MLGSFFSIFFNLTVSRGTTHALAFLWLSWLRIPWPWIPCALVSLCACDSLAGGGYEGEPVFTLTGTLESLAELPEDGEEAVASVVWLGSAQRGTRSVPQVEKVSSSGFPSTFSMTFFGPPRDTAGDEVLCPESVFNAIQDEVEPYRGNQQLAARDWLLYEELLIITLINNLYDRGIRASDYADQLTELEALDAIPETREEHDGLELCFARAEGAIRGLAGDAITEEPCFETASIVVFNQPLGDDVPTYSALKDHIAAVAKSEVLLFVEDPAKIRDAPEACAIVVSNPEELVRGYNLAAHDCTEAEENGGIGTLRIVKEQTATLTQADAHDLFYSSAACGDEAREAVRALDQRTLSNYPVPEGPLTLADTIDDAYDRAAQVDPNAGLAEIAALGINAEGEITPEVNVRQNRGWLYTFSNGVTGDMVIVRYGDMFAMVSEPRVQLVKPYLRIPFRAPIEDDLIGALPDSPRAVALFERMGCEITDDNRLVYGPPSSFAEAGDRFEMQFGSPNTTVPGRITAGDGENLWETRDYCEPLVREPDLGG